MFEWRQHFRRRHSNHINRPRGTHPVEKKGISEWLL